MPVSDRIELRNVDDEGKRGTTGVWTQDPIDTTWESDYSTLLDAYGGITEAGPTPVAQLIGSSIQSPTDVGAYSTIQDKAYFIFQCADGTVTTMAVPAPKVDIFLDDEETVDELDGLVVAFVNAMVALAANKFGSAIVGLLRGYRRRLQRKRK